MAGDFRVFQIGDRVRFRGKARPRGKDAKDCDNEQNAQRYGEL